MKRILTVCVVAMSLALCLAFAGCGGQKSGGVTVDCPLEDGTYTADFTTDSSMFHVNEAYKGKGILTVKDKQMTIHVVVVSTSIEKLFLGTADNAQKAGAKLIEGKVETVDYGDGTTGEANGFDIPVPYLDKEFDLALIGSKGKWYDHKVSVSNPEPVTE